MIIDYFLCLTDSTFLLYRFHMRGNYHCFYLAVGQADLVWRMARFSSVTLLLLCSSWSTVRYPYPLRFLVREFSRVFCALRNADFVIDRRIQVRIRFEMQSRNEKFIVKSAKLRWPNFVRRFKQKKRGIIFVAFLSILFSVRWQNKTKNLNSLLWLTIFCR